MADQAELLDLIVSFRRLDGKKRNGTLTELETKKWKELRSAIRRGMGGATGDEPSGRSDDRIDFELEAAFRTKDEFRKAYIKNLSGGGVFVATDERLPPGTRIALKLRLGMERLEVQGEVVWVDSIGSNSTFGKGCGVRFVDLDNAAESIIQEAVTREIERRAMAQTALTPEMVEKILAAPSPKYKG